MTIEEARTILVDLLPGMRAEQEDRDVVLTVGDEQVSYESLAKIALAFNTNEIGFENTTCEQGYYGEHSDGHTVLRISGVLDEPPKEVRGSRVGNLACSFCGKEQREVKKLIAGPTVYICDECVRLCVGIIGEG